MIFLDDLPTMKIGRRVYALSRSKPYTKDRFIIPMFSNFDDTLKYINNSHQNSMYHLHLKRIRALYVDRIYKDTILTQRIYMKNDLKKVYDYVKENCPDLRYMYKNVSQYSNRNLFYDISLINELIFSKEIKNYKFVDEYFKTIIKDILKSTDYEKKFIIFDIDNSDVFNISDIKKSDYSNPDVLYLFLYELKYNPDIDYLKNVFDDTTIVFTSSKGLFKISISDLEEYLKKNNSDIKDLLRDILLNFRKLKSSDDEESKNESKEAENDKAKHEITDVVIDTLENEDDEDDENDSDDDEEENVEKEVVIDTKEKKENKTEKEKKKDIPLIEEDVLDKVINMTDEPEKAKEVAKILKEVKNKSLERVTEMGEKERRYIEKVMNVTIDDVSYNELLEEVGDLNIPKESYDVTAIDDYNENAFVNFNKTYDKKLKKFDIAEISQSFSEMDVPLYIQKIETEDSSDELNYTEDVKMKFKDIDGNSHNVKVTLPKLVYDRFVYLGGSKKNIIGQIMSNPITKNDEFVIITTNRNKVRLSYRGGKYLSPLYSKFTRGLKKFEEEKKTDVINYESSFDSNFYSGETTREYNGISRFMSEIKTNKIYLTFDYEKSKQLYENDNVDDIILGEINNEKIILNKESETITTDGEYNGLALSEFLIKVSEEYIPELYKYIENIKTVPKTIVYTSVKILGKNTPLVLILVYLMGLDQLMDTMNIDYRIETKEKKPRIDKFREGIIEFKDSYLIYKYDSMANISIMGYLQRMELSGYNLADLEDKDTMASILEDEMGSHNFPIYIDNYNNTMIDAITKNILVHFSLPTKFTDLLIYANYLLSTAVNEKDIDIRNSRVRYQELITATMANVMAEEYENYSVSKKRGSTKAKFSMDKNAVIKKLYELPNLEEYSTVNPARELDKYSSASMKGLSGLNLDRAYTADKRLYDPSFYGKFSMTSAYSGSIGVVKHFGVDPKIISARGFFENVDLDDVEDLDSKTLLSISEVLTPMTTSKDDAPRTAINKVAL